MNTRNDLLSAVKALQDAANRHATDEVMAIFADDAEFELEGLVRLVGKKEIRSIFEYDAGVNSKIELINCNVTADTVNCQLVETNDRLRLAGVDRLVYHSCVLSFKNSLIRSWRAAPDPEAVRAVGQFWNAAGQWIARHFPTDYSRLFTREGRFVRSRENGERAVQLAKEYLSTVSS
jgi:hypothetical protein